MSAPILAHRLAGDAAEQLIEQKAEGARMVAVALAVLPDGDGGAEVAALGEIAGEFGFEEGEIHGADGRIGRMGPMGGPWGLRAYGMRRAPRSGSELA